MEGRRRLWVAWRGVKVSFRYMSPPSLIEHFPSYGLALLWLFDFFMRSLLSYIFSRT